MPEGYWITQLVDTIDLTGDNRNEIVIRWRKKKFSEGDTVAVTIFSQNVDNTFSEHTTFNNLYTPIFTDYTKEYNTGNAALDSVYQKFIYSNYNLVEFRNNTIIVGFFTDAGGGMDLHFTYRKSLNDWLLNKKVYWDYPDKVTGKQITGEARTDEQLSIKNFQIIDFL